MQLVVQFVPGSLPITALAGSGTPVLAKYRDEQVSREAGEGETVFTGIARVERLAWAMPEATSCRDTWCNIGVNALSSCVSKPEQDQSLNLTGAIDAMEEYLDFVDYGGATIFPEQIPAKDWKNFFIVDARDAAQFEKEHISGAVNIEWRQVLARRSELPKRQANPDLLQHGDVVCPSWICSSCSRV